MNASIASSTQSQRAVPHRGSRFRRDHPGWLASLGIAALFLVSAPALAATAPSLGTTSTYGIVSDTYTNTVAGTTINGDVCFTTGPAVVPAIGGATVTPCPLATGVAQGLATANLNGQACLSLGVGAVALDTVTVGLNPPGTFPPGCYSAGGAMDITVGTTVTLNGPGVYVFRPGGALTTGANTTVAMVGVCENDVFWVPTGATTLGANSAFVGNILDAAGITLGNLATLVGRALAYGGTVTSDTNTITVPTCAAFVPAGAAAVPTLSEWAMIMLAGLLAIAGFAAMRRRAR